MAQAKSILQLPDDPRFLDMAYEVQGAVPEEDRNLLSNLSPQDRETAIKFWQAVKSDFRYDEYLRGCLNCGVCTSGCPAAKFYDFGPREMIQYMMRDEVDKIWEFTNKKVWACVQCYTCSMRCPFNNEIAGLIMLLREYSVQFALPSAKEILAPYRRVLYTVLTMGNQVTPDMIQPDAFPDWGPQAVEESKNMDVYRKAIPVDLMQRTDIGWHPSLQTAVEMMTIMIESGVMDSLRGVDKDLYDMIMDIYEDRKSQLEEIKEKWQKGELDENELPDSWLDL
ncbi:MULTISPECIES: 4Fe-4S dicluster domain-containing protein [Metallosphaera]|uniref:Heterodisulfide reductase subunit C-like protein n=3 Tax=Metallosphaera TaxID=41980 RepID=A4YH00_METS5|nr:MULTISPECIES: 4Fe-4S dicluster domain-containing protein [Metallosphaera]ABP95702.1 Heterodisulfide reductase subunit C-like protein [Metallosphaera sedula DSM 5348]AIM27686.1 Heterodisulfide reductase subunit C-like protein [Metallosphaera sedula]AKV74543.1 heterodisulfide reductase subunit C [Metallosphaera sedula]AKV76782.1 heterodisulfide reductase subunit C [Metallosphaera sedula]AKV79033.1 heterodisulfide reductase subunit C [Metallosphaera sedula]